MAGRTLKSARGIIPVHPLCRCTWKPYIEGVMRKPTPFPRGIPFETAGVSLAGYRRKPKKPKKRRGGRIELPRKGIRAKAVRKVPRARSGLDMMDSSTRATFTNTMSELEARWGFKPDRIVSKDLGVDVPTEVVDVRGKKVMRLNPRYWKGANSRKLESELKQMTKDGWLAQPDLASHITHEYGHVVELGMSDKEHQRMRNAVGDIGNARLGKLSRYAMPPSYPQEAFCEALASDRNNGYVPKELKAFITPPKAAVAKAKKVTGRVGGKTVLAKKKVEKKLIEKQWQARFEKEGMSKAWALKEAKYMTKTGKTIGKLEEIERKEKAKEKAKKEGKESAKAKQKKAWAVEKKKTKGRRWAHLDTDDDDEKIRIRGDALFGPTTPTLSKRQQRVISEYQKHGYTEVNGGLRGLSLKSAEGEEIRKGLDNAIKKSIVPKDIVAFRGFSSEVFTDAHPGKLVGTVLSDKAFVSTSLQRSIAEDFAGNVFAEVRVPKGSHALWGPSFSELDDELELILPRDSNFRIVKAERKGDMMNVVLEVLP